MKRCLTFALVVVISLPIITACGTADGPSSPTAADGSRSASILATFSPTSIITNAAPLEVVVMIDGREWTGTRSTWAFAEGCPAGFIINSPVAGNVGALSVTPGTHTIAVQLVRSVAALPISYDFQGNILVRSNSSSLQTITLPPRTVVLTPGESISYPMNVN